MKKVPTFSWAPDVMQSSQVTQASHSYITTLRIIILIAMSTSCTNSKMLFSIHF